MRNESEGSRRLAALQNRQAHLQKQIAVEQERRRKQEAREQQRLFHIVGSALVLNASQHPDLDLKIKSILQTAVKTESDRTFLRTKGYL